VHTKDSDPWGNEPIYVGDKMIGRATSGAYAYTLGKSLAVGYVRPEFAKPGTKVEMILLGERHKAEVIGESPWDPENARLRA
jgi:dimethylglycine dehydrogenase